MTRPDSSSYIKWCTTGWPTGGEGAREPGRTPTRTRWCAHTQPRPHLRLVGPVRAPQLLHRLVRRPRQLQRHVHALPRVAGRAVGLGRRGREGGEAASVCMARWACVCRGVCMARWAWRHAGCEARSGGEAGWGRGAGVCVYGTQACVWHARVCAWPRTCLQADAGGGGVGDDGDQLGAVLEGLLLVQVDLAEATHATRTHTKH
jgi:hypothetical protein